LKRDWNTIRREIDDGKLGLEGEECVTIKLNDLDNENSTIDVFCILDDKQAPGFSLFLVMKTLRNNVNRFLKTI